MIHVVKRHCAVRRWALPMSTKQSMHPTVSTQLQMALHCMCAKLISINTASADYLRYNVQWFDEAANVCVNSKSVCLMYGRQASLGYYVNPLGPTRQFPLLCQ